MGLYYSAFFGIEPCHDTTSMNGLPAIWGLGITGPTSQHRSFKYRLSFFISLYEAWYHLRNAGKFVLYPSFQSERVIVQYAHTGTYNQVKWDRNITHCSRKYCGMTILDFVVQIQAFWIIHVSMCQPQLFNRQFGCMLYRTGTVSWY